MSKPSISVEPDTNHSDIFLGRCCCGVVPHDRSSAKTRRRIHLRPSLCPRDSTTSSTTKTIPIGSSAPRLPASHSRTAPTVASVTWSPRRNISSQSMMTALLPRIPLTATSVLSTITLWIFSSPQPHSFSIRCMIHTERAQILFVGILSAFAMEYPLWFLMAFGWIFLTTMLSLIFSSPWNTQVNCLQVLNVSPSGYALRFHICRWGGRVQLNFHEQMADDRVEHLET